MDSTSMLLTGLKTHNVEIYTGTMFIRGTISGLGERASDLINRWDTPNLAVKNADLVPLGQASNPKRIPQTVFVPRTRIHFVAIAPTAENISEESMHTATSTSTSEPVAVTNLRSRFGTTSGDKPASSHEYRVQKVPKLCFVFTSVFAISGLCHLVEGGTIESVLEGQAPFFPLTKATIHLQLYPDAPWHRDVVLVSKTLDAIYTIDPPSPPSPSSPSQG